jgi:hypothetical protein
MFKAMILMPLNLLAARVALQHPFWHNWSVSSTLLQSVDLAQSQQVAPFF